MSCCPVAAYLAAAALGAPAAAPEDTPFWALDPAAAGAAPAADGADEAAGAAAAKAPADDDELPEQPAVVAATIRVREVTAAAPGTL